MLDGPILPENFWAEIKDDESWQQICGFTSSHGLLTFIVRWKSMEDNSEDGSSIDLPAADARRLRDWLCARYPDADTGETK